MKIILLVIIFSVNSIFGFSQKKIIYTFEKSVNDSLKVGIDFFKMQTKNKAKLFAVISENDNEFEVRLQDYSGFSKSGILEIIKATDRKLKIDSFLELPVLFFSDILSIQIKKDRIRYIPATGYYFKIIYENMKQKVVEHKILL